MDPEMARQQRSAETSKDDGDGAAPLATAGLPLIARLFASRTARPDRLAPSRSLIPMGDVPMQDVAPPAGPGRAVVLAHGTPAPVTPCGGALMIVRQRAGRQVARIFTPRAPMLHAPMLHTPMAHTPWSRAKRMGRRAAFLLAAGAVLLAAAVAAGVIP